MDAIETMMEEHRLIERVLESLEAYVSALCRGDKVDRRDLCRFLEFIREYADAKHHCKEEGVLFQVMIENGFSRQTCPLAVMYEEHDSGRAHVREIAKLADKGEWSDHDRRELETHARSLASLLRAHIMKEDNVLYPLARGQLPPTAMAEVETRCAELERLQIEDGSHDRLVHLGRDLYSRYRGATTGDSGSPPTNLPITPTPLGK